MERRTALAIAAAAAGTVMAASAAFAANLGLLQHDPAPPISVLDTSAVSPETPLDPTVVTVIVEDPPVQVGTPVADGSSVGISGGAAVDDHGDDDSAEIDDHADDSSSSTSDDGYGEGADDDD